jgi:hypothetical protein
VIYEEKSLVAVFVKRNDVFVKAECFDSIILATD